MKATASQFKFTRQRARHQIFHDLFRKVSQKFQGQSRQWRRQLARAETKRYVQSLRSEAAKLKSVL